MIVLTGAGGGIGQQVIPELLKMDSVIGLYNKTPPNNTSFSTQHGNEVLFHRLDITQAKDVAHFKDVYREKLKNIVLIHLAALKIDGLALAINMESWGRVFDVNIHGDFSLTQALLPCMLHDSWGRIVHISSSSASFGDPGAIAYNASKAALTGLSRTLAKEYGRFNITSNILNLGYFDVGLIDSLPANVRKELISRIPSRKLGKVVNISNAISFLIQSDYVNGSTINIDGGL